MRKISKSTVSLVVALIMLLMSTQLVAFADEKLTVNGTEVSKGDIVTYEYYVGGIDDAVCAAGCYIEFDPEFLEYVDDSIGFDVLNNALINFKNVKDGSIYYSAVNAINGYDMSDSKLVVSISFKVLDTAKGSTEITHTFDEFFTVEDDSTDITSKEYTDSENIDVNTFDGKNTSPYLGTDADEVNKYIKNNSDYSIDKMLEGIPNSEVSVNSFSTAESSSNQSDSKSLPSTLSDTSASDKSSDNALQSQESSESVSVAQSETSVTAVTGNPAVSSTVEDLEGGNGLIIAVVVIVFAVAVIGAVVYLILSKKRLI